MSEYPKTEVRDRTITGEDVRLDDHDFVSCRLDGCRIFYGGGYYGLYDTTITNPTFAFDGAAQRTINLLSMFKLDMSGMHIPPLPTIEGPVN